MFLSLFTLDCKAMAYEKEKKKIIVRLKKL